MKSILQDFVLKSCEVVISRKFPQDFFVLGVAGKTPYLVTSFRVYTFKSWVEFIKFCQEL